MGEVYRGKTKKVRMLPGFSQLDWVRLTQRSTRVNGKASGARVQSVKYTREEVSQHRSERDAWMVVRGKVYNITK